MEIAQKNILNLKEAVSHKFGKDINSSNDCDELAAEINVKGQILNAQTLRRFFGLIKSASGFSQFTLDTLAQFCGFSDNAGFNENYAEDEIEQLLSDLSTEHQGKDYWEISNTLCEKISTSPALLANIPYKIIKYPMARTFFLEHHPMRDLAGTVYTQCFQEFLKYDHRNEAKLFAYGFLYMGAFLTENTPFMDIYAQKMRETDLSPEVYVLPAARKFGVSLLHSHLMKEEQVFAKVYAEMLVARKTYRETSQKSVCSFEYAVLEHLIFTDKTLEMRFLIENNTSQLFSDRSAVPQDRKENHEECWNIMCAVAYLKMKDYSACEKHLSQVNLEKLSLGWKKYYSILYYFVQYEFADMQEKTEIKNILTQLVEETHFNYYTKQLEKLGN